MRTQFQVSITQTGDREKLSATVLERELREVARKHFVANEEENMKVTVRHLVEDAPGTAPAAEVAMSRNELRDALRTAHQAGQKSGMRVGVDSFNAANGYAGDTLERLTKRTEA